MQAQFFIGLITGTLTTAAAVGIYFHFEKEPIAAQIKSRQDHAETTSVSYQEYIGRDDSSGSSDKDSKEVSIISGAVAEILDVADYTYIKIVQNDSFTWLATNKIELNKGDHIEFAENDPFYDFESKTIERTFEKIYFVADISVNGVSTADFTSSLEDTDLTSETTTSTSRKTDPKETSHSFTTLADLLDKPDPFVDQSVEISGKVVKVNNEVMGRNWVHLVDQSLAQKKQDLTLTTQATVQVNQVVVMRGRLALNRDFGSGYSYPVIIEDAVLVVE